VLISSLSRSPFPLPSLLARFDLNPLAFRGFEFAKWLDLVIHLPPHLILHLIPWITPWVWLRDESCVLRSFLSSRPFRFDRLKFARLVSPVRGFHFWDSLFVDSIACPKSLGRIRVRLIWFWFDLGFRGSFSGSHRMDRPLHRWVLAVAIRPVFACVKRRASVRPTTPFLFSSVVSFFSPVFSSLCDCSDVFFGLTHDVIGRSLQGALRLCFGSTWFDRHNHRLNRRCVFCSRRCFSLFFLVFPPFLHDSTDEGHRLNWRRGLSAHLRLVRWRFEVGFFVWFSAVLC